MHGSCAARNAARSRSASSAPLSASCSPAASSEIADSAAVASATMASSRGGRCVFDLNMGSVHTLPGLHGRTERAFSLILPSPAGDVIAMVGESGAVHLVSAASKQLVQTLLPASASGPGAGGGRFATQSAKFSPDGRLIASASFDKSAKVWDGRTGKFVGTMRGHAGPVYRLTWAPDSRMLVTGSEDSTMKLWNVGTCRLVSDLPGHSGSVFAVDWAPNGQRVGSGGADKTLKLWTQ